MSGREPPLLAWTMSQQTKGYSSTQIVLARPGSPESRLARNSGEGGNTKETAIRKR
jgi:hypothetical protein